MQKRKPRASNKCERAFFSVKANSRKLAYARYQQGATDVQVLAMAVKEILRFLEEGRVPEHVRKMALEACVQEIESGELNDTCSWDKTL
jgi:hypothetical protein